MVLWVLVATLPAAIVGLTFKHQIEDLFVSPRVAAYGLLITGVLLWLSRRIEIKETHVAGELSFPKSLAIGLSQAIAITPGISRSGSTITAGLFCKVERKLAARFSFLMSIPAILGSVVVEFKELKFLKETNPLPVLVGVLAAMVTGFFAIRWLFMIIQKGQLHLFSYYCLAVGVLALFIL